MTRRRIGMATATIMLTLAFAWTLGHIHWPDSVGLAMSQLSGSLGGIGIEDTEDMFMLLSFGVSFVIAMAIVIIIARRTNDRGGSRHLSARHD